MTLHGNRFLNCGSLSVCFENDGEFNHREYGEGAKNAERSV